MWSNHISSITGGTRKCYNHWGQVSGSIFLIFFLSKKKNLDIWLRWVFVAEHGLSLVAVGGGCSLARRLLIAVASCCRAGALLKWASVVVAHGFNCSEARGIFPEQGWNPCPLHR